MFFYFLFIFFWSYSSKTGSNQLKFLNTLLKKVKYKSGKNFK